MTRAEGMFDPPAAPVTVRGSIAGPLSSYWWVLAAASVLVWAFSRSNVPLAIGVLALVGLGAVVMWFLATGTEITVSAAELVVRRRLRPTWRIATRDFRYIVENIPTRPRAPSLAGWRFQAVDGPGPELELAMFAPHDRRFLRKLFRDVIVDADAGMRRP